MKMKIWIEEAMKEMVEEVEKNEPMPKHWKRNVLLFCLLSAVCFQTGLWVLAKNGIASADRSPLSYNWHCLFYAGGSCAD